VFESRLNQKVLSFYDDEILSKLISKWDGSSQNVVELGTILGIPDENLPTWIANLATWVVEDRITIADMIVAIEYIINN
jgi:glutathione S-transferase